jgi:PAS domain S-box-containing protein
VDLTGDLVRLRDENAALRAEFQRLETDDTRAAVAASERRLRDTLESIDEAFLLIGHDFRLLDLNTAASQLDGRPASQLISRNLFDLWPAARGSELEEALRRVIRDRVPETLLHQQHGRSDRWVQTRVFPSGAGLALFYRDVTERVRTESALTASERRFRAITEATPGIVFVCDADGRNIYVNPQFSELTGRSFSDLMGEGWLQVIHPDDRDRAAATWGGAVRTGRLYEIEMRFRCMDGAYRWLLCRGTPLDSDIGSNERWFGVGMDIDELVEARQLLARHRDALEQLADQRTQALHTTLAQLRLEQSRLRTVFEHSTECLFLLRVEPDRGPVFLDVNAPAAVVLGHEREAVIGRTPRELVPDPALATDTEEQLQAALRAGGQPHRYFARRRYGGQPHELEAVAVAVDGPNNERLILITARDVTERRALEEALRQSQKMEAVGQLTGGIAHDFNNLLTGIYGSIELMQARVARGQVQGLERYSTAAMESVRRAAALTHRLLAFARRQTLDPKPADLNQLVAGMEDLVRRTVGPGIAVETDLAADLWPTLCDGNQMESALLNLCINARDAMPEGGRLVIRTANVGLDEAYCARHRDLPPGDYIAVAVTDTGVGMSAEVAARAFEPFFTTKPIGQGTGLGLSMLYGFVRQSEGHVRIDTESGRGTTVHIYLPRHHGPVSVDQQGPSTTCMQQRSSGRHVVMVVEDEPVVRTVAAEVLSDLGYAVLEAGDGATALEVLQSGTAVDLLVTDVGMPGMNGRQLADAARAHCPGLKVLFITGYAHGVSVGGLLGPGMDTLGKPFAVDALAAKVAAMLAG